MLIKISSYHYSGLGGQKCGVSKRNQIKISMPNFALKTQMTSQLTGQVFPLLLQDVAEGTGLEPA